MHINDITIIDDSKLKKAITAAALGTRWSGSTSAYTALSLMRLTGLLPAPLPACK